MEIASLIQKLLLSRRLPIVNKGKQEWRGANNQLHNDDFDYTTGEVFPAVIRADGSKYWYKNGQLHRDGEKRC